MLSCSLSAFLTIASSISFSFPSILTTVPSSFTRTWLLSASISTLGKAVLPVCTILPACPTSLAVPIATPIRFDFNSVLQSSPVSNTPASTKSPVKDIERSVPIFPPVAKINFCKFSGFAIVLKAVFVLPDVSCEVNVLVKSAPNALTNTLSAIFPAKPPITIPAALKPAIFQA